MEVEKRNFSNISFTQAAYFIASEDGRIKLSFAKTFDGDF